MRIFSIIIILFFSFAKTFSQSVEGSWYGVGDVKFNGATNNYLTEFILHQDKDKVDGWFNYYFRDSLFKQPITGTFNSSTNELYITLIPVIFHQSVYTSIGVECNMFGSFRLSGSKNNMQLSGSFISEESHKYTCPPINFVLTKSTDTTVAQTENEETVIDDDDDEDTTVASKKNILDDRKINVVRTIEVVNDTVNLAFYDNGIIDHDTVSIYVDKKLIEQNKMLSLKPIIIPLKFSVNKNFYEISMYAVNMGEEPPNTAILIVHDGNYRYEVPLSSDFNTTATIRIKKKK